MAIKRLAISDLLVCIGRVIKPVGLKGVLKVQNYSDVESRFESLDEIYIGPNSDLAIPYGIRSVHASAKTISLELNHLDTIEAVERFRGQFCYVPRASREDLDQDEFYADDLIGLEVYSLAGALIGKVNDIMSTAANDVMAIQNNGNEILLPMVGEIIQDIDLDEGVVIINPIEGLLDTYNAG